MSVIVSNSEGLAIDFSTSLPETTWYVAYTHPRHEKRVAQQCMEREIHAFLPLYRSVRRWKDRKKELEMPLFPGYCFVRMDLRNRMRLLQLPGVVDFVMFQGRPAPVSAAEMESLCRGLQGSGLQPHPYLKAGKQVRVKHGPMTGVEGLFVRWKDRVRVVISITLIQRSVAVEVDEADIEVIG